MSKVCLNGARPRTALDRGMSFAAKGGMPKVEATFGPGYPKFIKVYDAVLKPESTPPRLKTYPFHTQTSSFGLPSGIRHRLIPVFKLTTS